MPFLLTREEFIRFVRMEPERHRALLAELSPADLLAFDAQYEFWASQGQIPPREEGWRTWLMIAGRGFGKTRAGAEWVHWLALARPVRIALVAATIDEARRVMVEGASGVLSVARRLRHKVKWEPSKSELSWRGGSVAQLYSGDNADGLRGPEHHFAWCPAADRRNARRHCRGGSPGSAADNARGRPVLHRRAAADWGVGWLRRPSGGIYRRRVALHRAG